MPVLNILIAYVAFIEIMLFAPPGELQNQSDNFLAITNVTDNCQSWDYVNSLVINKSLEINYTKGSYVCRHYAANLVKNLTSIGCSAQMVTGYLTTGYWVDGRPIRGWHRWVQTPYFNIEATPSNAGIITNMSIYSKSYLSAMNLTYYNG